MYHLGAGGGLPQPGTGFSLAIPLSLFIEFGLCVAVKMLQI